MGKLAQSDLFQRFWAVAGSVSVRNKILGIVLGLVVLLGFGVTLQVRAALRQALDAQQQQESISIARDLGARSTDLILVNDLYALHELLAETQANYADARYAFLLDEQGRVIAHTFGSGFPPGLIEANSVAPGEHHQTAVLETDEGRVWDTAVPIFDGRVGIARVGLSEKGLLATVGAVTRQMLATTVVVSVTGIAAATLLTWIVTRPLIDLKRAAFAVSRGDFAQRVPRWAGDEIGDLSETFNEMTKALARASEEHAEREQLRAQYISGVIAAQEDERKRIARELHDGTSQSLTSLLVGLQTVREHCCQADCASDNLQRLEELRNVVGRTLDEVHNMALELRPSVLDDLGLAAALERYVADCRDRYSLRIDLTIHGLGDKRLLAPVETALYRIVQEGLINVVRHAEAQTAGVLVERRGQSVLVIIEDDGCGFDPGTIGKDKRRLGLFGIRERAELLSGKVTVESAAGKGTTLFVELPLKFEASVPDLAQLVAEPSRTD